MAGSINYYQLPFGHDKYQFNLIFFLVYPKVHNPDYQNNPGLNCDHMHKKQVPRITLVVTLCNARTLA